MNLFGEELELGNDWQKHYIDMPEYNNVKQEEPAIEVVFKFRNQEDFNEFHDLIKKHLYNGKRVFDGMQRKNKKNIWYPLNEKASKYLFK